MRQEEEKKKVEEEHEEKGEELKLFRTQQQVDIFLLSSERTETQHIASWGCGGGAARPLI